jgi:hypothetical protein
MGFVVAAVQPAASGDRIAIKPPHPGGTMALAMSTFSPPWTPPPPGSDRAAPVDKQAWCDTIPACFRSEAFAEDLLEPEPPAPRRGGRRGEGAAALPLLGALMTLLLGAAGR